MNHILMRDIKELYYTINLERNQSPHWFERYWRPEHQTKLGYYGYQSDHGITFVISAITGFDDACRNYGVRLLNLETGYIEIIGDAFGYTYDQALMIARAYHEPELPAMAL